MSWGIVGLEAWTFAVQKEDCLYIFKSRGNGLLGTLLHANGFSWSKTYKSNLILLQILDPSKIENSSRLVLWSYLKSIATGEWMVCLERRSYNGSDLGKVALIQ